jgi:hypothetical protein
LTVVDDYGGGRTVRRADRKKGRLFDGGPKEKKRKKNEK